MPGMRHGIRRLVKRWTISKSLISNAPFGFMGPYAYTRKQSLRDWGNCRDSAASHRSGVLRSGGDATRGIPATLDTAPDECAAFQRARVAAHETPPTKVAG